VELNEIPDGKHVQQDCGKRSGTGGDNRCNIDQIIKSLFARIAATAKHNPTTARTVTDTAWHDSTTPIGGHPHARLPVPSEQFLKN
jgi:hypothetical protein